MAGAGLDRDRGWHLPRAVLARAVAVAAAARPRHRPARLRCAGGRGRRAAVPRSGADRDRGTAPAGSREPLAASAGDRGCRPDGAGGERSVRGRAVARPCRARACRRPEPQGRRAGAAAVGARSVCAARPRVDAGGGDILRGRLGALSADCRGVRLARRGDAVEFPHRCLGGAADLHRSSAADPAGRCGPARLRRRGRMPPCPCRQAPP